MLALGNTSSIAVDFVSPRLPSLRPQIDALVVLQLLLDGHILFLELPDEHKRKGKE